MKNSLKFGNLKLESSRKDKNIQEVFCSNVFVGIQWLELLWKTNYSTCYSSTWVSSFQWLFVSFFAQIIFFCMNNDWPYNNWVLTKKWNNIIFKTHVRISERIWNKIAKITNMSLFFKWATVSFSKRIVMRACSCAAIS